MPPKTKFSREEIIETAFKLVRSAGIDSLSARTVAKALGASTRPIYAHFSMAELTEIIINRAHQLLAEFEKQVVTGLPQLDLAINYINFAKAEKYLWRALVDERFFNYGASYRSNYRQRSDQNRTGIDESFSAEQHRMLYMMTWIFMRGAADMVNQSLDDDFMAAYLNDDHRNEFIQEALTIIWKGIKHTG